MERTKVPYTYNFALRQNTIIRFKIALATTLRKRKKEDRTAYGVVQEDGSVTGLEGQSQSQRRLGLPRVHDEPACSGRNHTNDPFTWHSVPPNQTSINLEILL
ncbi:hypothetical protein EUGRSUZ_H03701 [Eucalyptus grandis]|uniref:Uncharacterized protein n=2 Tax=Eucalyptus grandis TaxID=71139 RepID=A0ACC3JUQ6_EUCGR|nr:hypothetical protein EUGRSUZ_H03701 [Eucalyptus grandis]